MTEREKPSVTCEVSGDTLVLLAQLTRAVEKRAEFEGEPAPSPADVLALAVQWFHAEVFGQARRMIADAERERDGATAH